MSTADYVGRTVDVLAWDPGSLLAGSLGGDDGAGQVVTGLLKMAQRFLILLLNETNTIKYNYYGHNGIRGCEFMTELRLGQLRTELDVFTAFGLAELHVRQQMLAMETDDTPDDEKYKRAQLHHLELTGDTVKLYIAIESRASTATVIMPVPVVI